MKWFSKVRRGEKPQKETKKTCFKCGSTMVKIERRHIFKCPRCEHETFIV